MCKFLNILKFKNFEKFFEITVIKVFKKLVTDKFDKKNSGPKQGSRLE